MGNICGTTVSSISGLTAQLSKLMKKLEIEREDEELQHVGKKILRSAG
uniref:Uncharacterized protein n=1 Tax=uncultured bacterium BLR5 TaxID=506522 RepID=C0INW0_9BACT|nr:hypothetical protein AKSOIL_0033 [uncultured bacterium BLR5]